jgi:Na+-translocating ferredoxin:NAD+ oxidoreductase subunit G
MAESDHNAKSESIALITLNLLIASLVSGIVIASVYFATAPYASEQRIKQKNEAMRSLIPTATTFRETEVNDSMYIAKDNDTTLGFIVITQARGYGGNISIMSAIDQRGRIISYKILSHSETPGLGSKADLPEFKNQFTGKAASELIVSKRKEPGKIDAITGATITSNAVAEALKQGIARLKSSMKEPESR